MAENQQEDRSTEDLSEEASQHRIDEMREKGQVVQSKELTSLLALLATSAMVYAMSPKMGAQLAEYMREVFRTDLTARINLTDSSILGDTLMKALKLIIAIGLPISVAGFLLGVLGSFLQVGSIFSFHPITPDFSKIDPLAGIKRLFSAKNAVDGLRITVKVTISLAIAYALIKTEVLNSPGQMLAEPVSQLGVFGRVGRAIFLSLFGVFSVFGVMDLFLQRREWGKQVRLTKEEAKKEFKEREGDPQIKARIRAVQRVMSRKRMMAAIKKADVIITNPTHIAIAIEYDKEKMAAPRVVAKGADFVAQKIRQIATDAGIPLVENVPLVRTLYKTVKVNHAIPRALYQAVAEVLAYVYRLKNHRF